MAWTLVGHASGGFADGSGGHAFDSGLGAATAGDWDILTANSDTSIPTPPTGWTLATSNVSNQGAYLYVRKASGGESGTVTVTTNGNFNTAVTWSRWRGGNAQDVAVNAHADSSSGTSIPAVSTGVLASSNDLVVAFAALHSAPTQPTSPVWSSGFTAMDSVNQGGSSQQAATTFTAYKTGAGTAAESPSVSWTNAASDRYVLVVAFTPAGGGASITGTASAALGGLTASGTGYRGLKGSASASLGALSAAGTGLPPASTGASGWYTLLQIAREAELDRIGDPRNREPVACPRCGEPLAQGLGGIRHCAYDGWQFPRDWVDPF